MFKHKVSYKDFNGNDREEELHFHLSLPEVTRLEAEIGKPLEEHIRQLTTNQEMHELLAFLERMLLNSYGQKTSDGRTFHKSKETREAFEYSQAYAEMFEQILSNPDLARKFGESVADNGKVRKNKIAPEVVNAQPTE